MNGNETSMGFSCVKCLKELKAPGALVFSPPSTRSSPLVVKHHLCNACWKSLRVWLACPERDLNAKVEGVATASNVAPMEDPYERAAQIRSARGGDERRPSRTPAPLVSDPDLMAESTRSVDPVGDLLKKALDYLRQWVGEEKGESDGG